MGSLSGPMGPAAKSAKTQGGSMATPATAKYLTIDWQAANFTRARKGYADEGLGLSGLVHAASPLVYDVDGQSIEVRRPVLLYVPADSGNAERNAKAEATMFKSDDLAVASKAIRFLQASPEDLPERLRAEVCESLPAILLLDSQGREFERLTGSVQAGSLERKVNKLYRAHWDGSLSAMAKRARSFSIELDELNKEVALANAELTECETALKAKATNGNKRKVAKAKEAQAKVDAELKDVLDARSELAQPKLAKGLVRALVASK